MNTDTGEASTSHQGEDRPTQSGTVETIDSIDDNIKKFGFSRGNMDSEELRRYQNLKDISLGLTGRAMQVSYRRRH